MTNHRLPPLIVASVTFFAIAYVSWQLVGLRYTNHDDIYFNLYSQYFSGNYFDFAATTAFKQARIQAFINMPLVLFANSLQSSAWYDALNISFFLLLYLSILYFYSKLLEIRIAAFLVAFTACTFPLHYYFTFPQGYPLMASWAVSFAFVSAGLFGSTLSKPNKVKYVLSILFFVFSLCGAEYNFILHPLLLIIVFFSASREKHNIRDFFSLASPYLVGFILVSALYLAFSYYARATGGDDIGRVSIGFDTIAWIKTFLVLQEKSFLPISLINGITFISADIQKAGDFPTLFEYSNIFIRYDAASIAIVFTTSMALLFFLLGKKVSINNSISLAAISLLSIATVPALVLAASSHYQDIVLKGWIQGHLVTFYSHLGLSGLLFLGIQHAISKTPGVKKQITVRIVACILLSGHCTSTFTYNNINRQAMMQNKQKWQAMDTLLDYVSLQRSDLQEKELHAPVFWTSTGVSAIPGKNPYDGANYWTTYTEKALGQKLLLLENHPDPPADSVEIKYTPTPGGSPVVLLEENVSNKMTKRTAITAQAMAGDFIDLRDKSIIHQVDNKDWMCANVCTLSLYDSEASDVNADVIFSATDTGRLRLISQFFLQRHDKYAISTINNEETKQWHVANWGPQEAVAGVAPNLLENGNSGIWIVLDAERTISNLQVTLDGQPALETHSSLGLITASFSPDAFLTPGPKEIAIQDFDNGTGVTVGTLVVHEK